MVSIKIPFKYDAITKYGVDNNLFDDQLSSVMILLIFIIIILVGCESGSYFNYSTSTCDTCPIGTYNDGSIIDDCIQCPAKTTTARDGSKSEEQCIGNCIYDFN